MKIEWKTLSLAMICSIIVTGIVGLGLSLSNIILTWSDIYADYLFPENQYSSKVSYTIAVAEKGGPPFVLPLWVVIGLGLICIVVLIAIFYFVIGYAGKRRK